MKLVFTSLSFLLLLSACVQTTEKNQAPPVETEATEAETITLNVDSLVNSIDELRAGIEAQIQEIEPVSISSDSLRAKIKQQWSKIHYYPTEDGVVRIKTYPYEQISKRTEEFYFSKGQLVLAVIEDDGEGSAGKAKESIDKLYYYHNNEPIREIKNTEEREYTIKESDAEELIQEAAEYMDIYLAKK